MDVRPDLLPRLGPVNCSSRRESALTFPGDQSMDSRLARGGTSRAPNANPTTGLLGKSEPTHVGCYSSRARGAAKGQGGRPCGTDSARQRGHRFVYEQRDMKKEKLGGEIRRREMGEGGKEGVEGVDRGG